MHKNKQAITAEQAAEVYGLSKGTLANMRFAKKGPKFYKVGRKILYKVTDLEAWLYQNPVQTLDSRNDR
ncbi:MAG: helix-turn-helix domain-containing protein [Proteobacteria bacterium]|nr:helix-turn-helix domain-containing protein [Pseudomonadota bacterium]